MKLKQLFPRLEAYGFRIQSNDGSRKKIFPPMKDKPFYSFHGDLKENHGAFFALNRFAKKNWGIDLNNL